MKLADTSAVVTGGGNGIGKALAQALAQRGVNVAVADIEADAADAVADEIAELGVTTLAMAVDVSDPAAVERLADAAWERFGSVELLFNNAGVNPSPHRLTGSTADDAQWCFGVNVFGVLNGIRAFGPRFVESDRPCRIVNTGSEHSLGVPHTGAGIYTATKHAVLALSDVLRRELPDHVGVSIICPGIIESTLWRASQRRPDTYGGTTEAPSAGAQVMAQGLPAIEIAEHALDQIEADAFYIVTHPHVVEYPAERWSEIADAFAAQAPRYPGDDEFAVDNVIARLFQQ